MKATQRHLETVDHSERQGLLPNQRGVSIRRKQFDRRLHAILAPPRKDDWIRPYWLGLGLFLVLFPFWILDSLKDPVFGTLIDGDLQLHLPTAKLCSVCVTLTLVCLLEYIAQEQQHNTRSKDTTNDETEEETLRSEVLHAGGTWNRMELATQGDYRRHDDDDDDDDSDSVPPSIFGTIGMPYSVFFGLLAYLLQFNGPLQGIETAATNRQLWKVLGYCVYAAIESFGSLAVATFWSYTNSTLSLHDAESYYGTIIACAQMGAIFGSTMVTMHVWTSITLFIVACLVIILHIVVMMTYAARFPPSTTMRLTTRPTTAATREDTAGGDIWSGVYLILKHNYVLLVLGVSCLYEVSLTCLNYQMTLLGWNRFAEESPNYDPNRSTIKSMSFTQFMGHYGQMVNILSLVLSSLVFPLLIRRLGLKSTLRIFPTLLLLANLVAFIAFPGNLGVLFFSMSLLKAMTYSIHDPAKELLYIPCSNAIKFKSKFWIDVVGARFAKAIGSSINHVSGSVHRSIRISSAPSLLTAVGLWYTCYRVGLHFEDLVETSTVVGVDDSDPVRGAVDLSAEHEEDGDGRGEIQETPDALELTAL